VPPDSSSPRFQRLPGNLLEGASALLVVATLLGFCGRWHWFPDLFSHFRVQYLVALSIVGGSLLLLPRKGWAMACFACAVVNFAPILPMYVDREDPPHLEPDSTLRAMLLNVNTRLGEPDAVTQLVREHEPDLVALLEIDSRWLEALESLATSHPHVVTRPRGDNFGIGLFSRFPIEESRIVEIGPTTVPSIRATVSTEQGRLRLLATHPPPPVGPTYSRWRNEQLADLSASLDPSGPLLLLGDLNTTPWNVHFRRLLERSGLHDSARGHGVQTTWPADNLLLRIPLDHCLHSSSIVIEDRWTGPGVGSDHLPVFVDFAIRKPSNERGE